MVDITATDPMLTLMFEDGEHVTLQYHPSTLSMQERSFVSNRPGLNDTITFFPPAETADGSIQVSSYLTAIIPKRDDFTNTEVATSMLVSMVFTGLSASKEALDFVEGVFGAVSLAKGWYDVISGRILPRSLNPMPRGMVEDQFKKLKKLDDALHEGIACSITWDVDNSVHDDREYIITQMGYSAESIREEDGATLILKMDLTLSKKGVEIRVV